MTYPSGFTCTLQSAVEALSGRCGAVGYTSGPLDLPDRASLATHVGIMYAEDVPAGSSAHVDRQLQSATRDHQLALQLRHTVPATQHHRMPLSRKPRSGGHAAERSE